MSRAIVLIGVSRTARNAFPTLEGVEDAIVKMEAWAKRQDIPHIVKLSDVGVDAIAQVTVALITSEIEKLASMASPLEQLIIYFSGHGIVNAANEYQLLSLAPYNANEAINLMGSQALAQTWKVPHVVFFSDACRTVAPTVQVDRITGSAIIPNEFVPGPEKPVDIFYATRVGSPALEVANGKRYIAIYTEVLSKGLDGKEPSLIKDGYIRPRPLKQWLAQAVPEHLIEMKLNVLISQSPDARISSGDDKWLSKFDGPSKPEVTVPTSDTPPAVRGAPQDSGSETDDLSVGISRRLTIHTAEAAAILLDGLLDEPLEQFGAVVPRPIDAIDARKVLQRKGRVLSKEARELLIAISERGNVPLGLGDDDHASGFRVLGTKGRSEQVRPIVLR